MTIRSDSERITLLEYKVELIETAVGEIDRKLDELLALRQKGMGAFWLASSILGTGIIGAIALVFNWFRGY